MTAAAPPPRTAAPRRNRGALEPREDRMAVFWTIAVTALFALVLLLALVGVPSRFFPGPTVAPLPSQPLPSFSIPVSPSIEVIPPSVPPSATPAT